MIPGIDHVFEPKYRIGKKIKSAIDRNIFLTTLLIFFMHEVKALVLLEIILFCGNCIEATLIVFISLFFIKLKPINNILTVQTHNKQELFM